MALFAYHEDMIEVTDTAVEIYDITLISIVVKNEGPEVVYLGGSGVTADRTSTGGYSLAPGESVLLVNRESTEETRYAITAGGTSYVSVMGS